MSLKECQGGQDQTNNHSKEQPLHGAGINSPEHPPQRVWDILERKARRSDKFLSGRMTREEYDREGRELDRLKEEIDKKGTARDKLTLDLYTEITIESGNLPVPVVFRELSLEEFYQLRSQIEPLTEDEVAEALHKQKEANERKFEEFHKRTRGSCSYRGFSLAKP